MGSAAPNALSGLRRGRGPRTRLCGQWGALKSAEPAHALRSGLAKRAGAATLSSLERSGSLAAQTRRLTRIWGAAPFRRPAKGSTREDNAHRSPPKHPSGAKTARAAAGLGAICSTAEGISGTQGAAERIAGVKQLTPLAGAGSGCGACGASEKYQARALPAE